MLSSFASQFESETQHAVHAAPSENSLLHGDLVVGAFVEPSANVRVFPLIVLANDGEIDLTGLPVLQGRFDSVEQTHGTKIDVLPEGSPDGNQKPPKRDMIGNAWVANGAEENGVERLQLPQAVVGHHLSGLHVRFAAPVKRVPLQAKIKTPAGRFEHTDTFRNHFLSDAVSGDDRDVKCFHQFLFILLTLIAAVTARTHPEQCPTPL